MITLEREVRKSPDWRVLLLICSFASFPSSPLSWLLNLYTCLTQKSLSVCVFSKYQQSLLYNFQSNTVGPRDLSQPHQSDRSWAVIRSLISFVRSRFLTERDEVCSLIGDARGPRTRNDSFRV